MGARSADKRKCEEGSDSGLGKERSQEAKCQIIDLIYRAKKKKTESFRQYAENAETRSRAAYKASCAAVESIPFGQPILVGHHSEGRHRNALKRQDRQMQKSIEENDKAAYWNRRVAHREHRTAKLKHAQDISDAAEGVFEVGEIVTARFTNCNRFLVFRGEIVGRTVNDWKVKALESPYVDQGEAPGRVFRIPTVSSRKYSRNNRIEKLNR